MPGHATATGIVSGAASMAGSSALAAGNGNVALLATTDYNERRAIIQKYGYSSQFAIWFLEEPLLNHWTLNGWGNIYCINMDRRKPLKEVEVSKRL